jgi:fimbrial isopeptide formation D2 family protein/LPXTG-motif cell wall-anchored protein
MKTAKKIVSLMLTVFMIVVTAVSVSAASVDVSGHTYIAYQILKGNQEQGSTILTAVQAGDNVDFDALLTTIKNDSAFVKDGANIFTGVATATQLAEKLETVTSSSTMAKAFAKDVFANKKGTGTNISGTNFAAGYYLVVDETDLGTGADTVKNPAILRLTGDGAITFENKTSLPEVVKKVKNKNDSTGAESGWQDGADYDLNDDVPFKITAMLPSNYADYTAYKLVFHDTLSAGMTFNENSLKVYLNSDTNDTNLFTKDTDYSVTVSGENITITFTNLNATTLATAEGTTIDKDSQIIVEYSAKLTGDNVVYGSVGNPNKVYLEYSNDPDNSGTGDTDKTGHTPEDKVIVFTYQLTVNKQNSAGEALEGAGFSLYKYNSASTATDKYDLVETIAPTTDSKPTSFTFKGLDEGTYKLVESTTPANYNTAEDVVFTITSSYDTDSSDPKFEELRTDNSAVIANSTTDSESGAISYNGTLSTDVVNKRGAELPTTGGMGTRLFTVCGLILMGGAAILLVTRKRMSR